MEGVMMRNKNKYAVAVRLTKEEKKKLYDENVDSIIAANRDQLIAAYNLSEDATDDEIKEHYTVDEMQNPQTQAFSGCKLAANGNVIDPITYNFLLQYIKLKFLKKILELPLREKEFQIFCTHFAINQGVCYFAFLLN